MFWSINKNKIKLKKKNEMKYELKIVAKFFKTILNTFKVFLSFAYSAWNKMAELYHFPGFLLIT